MADKGMPAALFMTLIKTLIRSAAKESRSPSVVLKQVNELLIQDSKNTPFVTVFFGVLDLNSGGFIYSNAGHNPPIVKRAHSVELAELTRTGMALGVFMEIEIEECDISLNSGDLIVFYTDGVTEAFSLSEEMFGTKRLFDLISFAHNHASKELFDVIEDSVYEFIRGVDLSDDLTLMTIFRMSD